MFNPYMILGALALCVAAFFEGIHYQRLEDVAQIAQLNEQTRQVEQQRVQEANDHAIKLRDANAKADQQIIKLKSDVASGELRLSLRAVQPASDPASAARAGVEARCDIDPTAAQSLVTIAADGDKAIRQLNELIDFYNQVRSAK